MASAFVFKTLAEQRLEHLESLNRPLTDEESDELRRSLHAVYCHKLRLERAARLERELSGALIEHAKAERETLLKVAREAGR